MQEETLRNAQKEVIHLEGHLHGASSLVDDEEHEPLHQSGFGFGLEEGGGDEDENVLFPGGIIPDSSSNCLYLYDEYHMVW